MQPAPFQKLLVGLDVDTERGEVRAGSRRAAIQARALAGKLDASVVFYHSTFHERDGVDDAEHGGDAAPEVTSLLERFVSDEVHAGIRARLVVGGDPPFVGMIRQVLAGEADLVVVGKRSEVDQDERKLGTVAGKLLRKCPGPVWVVHPGHDPVSDTVLAATDLTPVGDRATVLAAEVASLFGAVLHIVHAYSMPMSLQLESASLDRKALAERLGAIEDSARTHILETLGPLAERGVEIHVGCTSPTRAIDAAVRRLTPDLLVMGTLSRTGIVGLLVGNTAERLLPRVDCSLLTLKPAGFVSPVTPG